MNVGDSIPGIDITDEFVVGNVIVLNNNVEQILGWYTGKGAHRYLLTLSFDEYFGEKIAQLHIYAHERDKKLLTLIYDDELFNWHIPLSDITAKWCEDHSE